CWLVVLYRFCFRSLFAICSFPIVFRVSCFLFFFFNYPPTTYIYTLSLHDALPIFTYLYSYFKNLLLAVTPNTCANSLSSSSVISDRKSTRLNSSHVSISYAVFCLKKKTSRLPESEIVENSCGHDERSDLSLEDLKA